MESHLDLREGVESKLIFELKNTSGILRTYVYTSEEHRISNGVVRDW